MTRTVAAGAKAEPTTSVSTSAATNGVPAATGHDKTSFVCFQRVDRPGSLLAILQEFAARSINLSKLESRPTKKSLGDYCFLIDLEGHIADELVADALRSLHAKAASVMMFATNRGNPTGSDFL